MVSMGVIPKVKRPPSPSGWTGGYQPKEKGNIKPPDGGSSVKPKDIGILPSKVSSAVIPIKQEFSISSEVSTIVVGDKITPSKIDKGLLDGIMSHYNVQKQSQFIVCSILTSINFDDINTVFDITKSLNEINKKVLDTLLNNNLDSEKKSVLDDLSTIKKWMRSPSWFDSFFFGITIEDYLKKIDVCVDSLVKKTNIIKKDIDKIDEQTKIVNEQLIQIDARITSCDIILELLDGEYKVYREKYYDVISKIKNNLMLSKQLMLKDPMIVKLSRDNLFNLIQSIEFDIFVLIHEWKASLKLKKFKTDSDIKKMMSDIQKKIVTEIGR